MGHDDIHKFRKAGRRERVAQEKALKARQWLIVCEGAKTEPNYFRGLIDYFRKDKGGSDIFNNILKGGGNVRMAIANAKNLDDKYRNERYADHNPRTKVFELVSALAEEAGILL
jgi:hypothetical protein